MDSIQKFMEAAKAFQSDDLYLSLQKAKKENDEDVVLQEQIQEFNLVRMNLNSEIEEEGRSEDTVAELNERINTLYNEIMGNKNMQAYNKAKQDVEEFMEHVNAVMNEALEGGDPFQVEKPTPHSCSDGCASCAGCH